MSSRYFWTTPEIAIIREHYGVGGVGACLPLLPRRTRGGIFQQAAKLGIRSPVESKRGKPRQRHNADMFSDAAIRAVYENKPTRNAVNELAVRIGKPRGWVSQRAEKLGLVVPRFREAAWTDDECDLLETHAHKDSRTIARIFRSHGYSRSATAIHVKRKRLALGITASRQAAGLYNANQIATLMGVDGKTVTRWINLEMIKAGRRGTARAGTNRDEHEITEAQLRRFVVTYPQSVDLRKVDKLWFIEMMGRAAA